MARVKRGVTARAKAKKIMKLARGYKGTRSRHYKNANEAVMHAGQYAYEGRKKRKGDFRRLWIARINAATRTHGMSYSVFINALKKANIQLDRKAISELAIHNPAAFTDLITIARENAA